MSIAKWSWKPRDVERAIAAVRKAGLAINAVTVSKQGNITVATSTPTDSDGVDPWKQTVANLENDRPTTNSKPRTR
jgi:hypothetical protein